MSEILGKLFGKDKDKSHKGDKGLHNSSGEGSGSGSHSVKWNDYCKYRIFFLLLKVCLYISPLFRQRVIDTLVSGIHACVFGLIISCSPSAELPCESNLGRECSFLCQAPVISPRSSRQGLLRRPRRVPPYSTEKDPTTFFPMDFCPPHSSTPMDFKPLKLRHHHGLPLSRIWNFTPMYRLPFAQYSSSARAPHPVSLLSHHLKFPFLGFVSLRQDSDICFSLRCSAEFALFTLARKMERSEVAYRNYLLKRNCAFLLFDQRMRTVFAVIRLFEKPCSLMWCVMEKKKRSRVTYIHCQHNSLN